MATTSTPFKKGSLTNLVLNYASSKRYTYITIDGVFSIFGKKAEKPSRVIRSIETLKNNGLLKEVDADKWSITAEGLELLWRSATPNTRREE